MAVGVGDRALQPGGVAAGELGQQGIVVAVPARIQLADGSERRIDALRIERRGVTAGLRAAGIQDGKRVAGGGRGGIGVAGAKQVNSPAPHVGDSEAGVLGEFAFHREVALLRVWIAPVFVGEEDGGSAEHVGLGGQGIREHGRRGQLRGRVGVQAVAGLVKPIAEKEVFNGGGGVAVVKHAISRADYRLGVQSVGDADARSPIASRGGDPAGLREGWVGLRRLRDGGVFVANSGGDGELGIYAPLILDEERDLAQLGVHDGVPEGLAIALKVLGAGGVAGEIERELA